MEPCHERGSLDGIKGSGLRKTFISLLPYGGYNLPRHFTLLLSKLELPLWPRLPHRDELYAQTVKQDKPSLLHMISASYAIIAMTKGLAEHEFIRSLGFAQMKA